MVQNPVGRRRQRWLLFAGRRPLSPRARRTGEVVAVLTAAGVGWLLLVTLSALANGAGKSALWPLALAGTPWSLLVIVTSPAWGSFSFSATPDWLIAVLFGAPALLNASVAGGIAGRWVDGRRRRRQRVATSASARS